MNEQDTPQPQWTTLPSKQRRVLGVLVEKAKTTPNAYPLTLNSLVTGCNQKSNRFPVMDLDSDEVEDALDALREAGGVAEVHGDGRTVKYRHYMKDWLGVDGTELAVMAELLLRGAQTVGELRGRAARMAKTQLAGMSELKPVLQGLIAKKLVVALTAEGRGQVVTHGLYSDSELQRLRNEHAGGVVVETRAAPAPVAAAVSSTPSSTSSAPAPVASVASQPAADGDLRSEVESLREEVAKLRKEVEDIWASLN